MIDKNNGTLAQETPEVPKFPEIKFTKNDYLSKLEKRIPPEDFQAAQDRLKTAKNNSIEYAPGHNTFDGPTLFAISRKESKDTYTICPTTYFQYLSGKAFYDRPTLGATVIVKTSDDQYLVGRRMAYQAQLDKDGQRIGLATRSHPDVDTVTITKEGRPQHYVLNREIYQSGPSGYAEICAQDLTDSVKEYYQKHPDKLLFDLFHSLREHASNELHEEFLRELEGELHLKDIISKNIELPSKTGKIKKYTVFTDVVFECVTQLTAKDLIALWSQEENRGVDWVELPQLDFLTKKQLANFLKHPDASQFIGDHAKYYNYIWEEEESQNNQPIAEASKDDSLLKTFQQLEKIQSIQATTKSMQRNLKP